MVCYNCGIPHTLSSGMSHLQVDKIRIGGAGACVERGMEQGMEYGSTVA